jgi:hypothetical protein
MSQNLDKNKIRDSIQKARPQDLLYLTINPTDKDSKKNALAKIDKFIGKGHAHVLIIKE